MTQETTPQRISTRPTHWLLLAGVVAVTLILDQITKAAVVANLSLYEDWTPIPALAEFFQITYTRNTGAAFGLFPTASNVFLVVAVIASGVIIYYYRQIRGNAWLLRIGMGMMMGGALGNALDRITRGYVVDFLHVFYEPIGFNYPVFNLADSGIVIGVFLLILLLGRHIEVDDKEENAATDSEAPPPDYSSQ
ncbi:MAG: signal peptidase II [Anaerolineales bacterium]